ncbi:hypothetical protein SERLADRAFT_369636 [Serpula lacrymans var. lacrymans S7.9]|uniref:Ctf8-domain-containing protein n=1 Tax=Serpula lacrymans var. lacrymans (strain S7.9) TaxID=578457 RepID=F8NWP5_SERL9|nr:uncharacterized protein SERLADRAFT_369636 [Serpula lacrymans var. lacrymans S7.9]EGO24397.1 hypothetical protein SERLADRAFT_369636 [Serpula lacrymans var. lacrymans S7.9]
MIIPITIPSPSDTSDSPKLPPQLAKLGHDELFLIELQGSLDVEGTGINERDGRLVGKLQMDDSNKPTLVIGHHLLEGKVVNLVKPLGVLHRKDRNGNSDQPSSHIQSHDYDQDGEPQVSSDESQKEPAGWDVVAVVKKKIVFSKRPMPIAGNVG